MKIKETSLELMVVDVASTVSFYGDILGFKLLASENDEQGIMYWAKMSLGEFFISFKEQKRLNSEMPFYENLEIGGSISICLLTDDLEKDYDIIRKKFETLDHPHLTPCGSTQFSMKDNNGYIITFERI